MNNENELTAALATIEKCREVSGCPAGVDLQDWVKQLAAENVGLKSAAEFATAPDMWIEQADGMLDYRYCDWYVDVLKAAMETPATNAVLTELRNEAGARAVELFAKTLGSPYTFRDEKCYEDGFTRAIEVVRDTQAPRFAKQLREVSK